MNAGSNEFPALLQRFFARRLIGDCNVSPHTISAYRDGFRQYLKFLKTKTGREPSRISFSDVTAETVSEFLDDLDTSRGLSARSRNLRLTTIHSFVRYASHHVPEHLEQFQRILAIPTKKFVRTEVSYLTRDEQTAVLAAPDRQSWCGRRNYMFLLLALQTGLRLSEMTSLRRCNFVSSPVGAHVEVTGKGRKHRTVPLLKGTYQLLDRWVTELPDRSEEAFVFPSVRGARLTVHGVRGIVSKCTKAAEAGCPTLRKKRVTMHSLRHSTAMDLLQAGVDSSVIALWLGHESVQTTHIYVQATMAMKERALASANFIGGASERFVPGDDLLRFLNSL